MPDPGTILLNGAVSLTNGQPWELVALDLTPPSQRQEWVGSADSEYQALTRQPDHDNRKITAKIRLAGGTYAATMDTALGYVGTLVDSLRAASAGPEGVPLAVRLPGSAKTVTFDVLAGQIVDVPIGLDSDGITLLLMRRPTLSLELDCKPYWRGVETLLSTATSSQPLVEVTFNNTTGDIPGLGRLLITDQATQARRHVEWGLEGPSTLGATSLIIDSDNMTATSSSAQNTASGWTAYDPNNAGTNILGTSFVPATPTAIALTPVLDHVGTFRVKARVWANQTTSRVRFTWQAGDSAYVANDWATPPVASLPVEVNLGLIFIPRAPSGTSQRWQGRVEVYETGVVGSVVMVDMLELIPVAEGYATARAPYTYEAGLSVAFDQFDGVNGTALNGRVAVGGTWATSGDATDFTLLSPGQEERATSVASTTGRIAVLGSTNYTDVQVDINAYTDMTLATGPTVQPTILARYVDASNHLRFYPTITRSGSEANPVWQTWKLETVVAGVVTTLATSSLALRPTSHALTLRLVAYASGRTIAQAIASFPSPVVQLTLDGSSAALATGGTLATGKPGFRDFITGAPVRDTLYGNFFVNQPPTEQVVMYAGRALDIRSDAVVRFDSTGVYPGEPRVYQGSLFEVPVGQSRAAVKVRRADVAVAADEFLADTVRVDVYCTPRGLALPR